MNGMSLARLWGEDVIYSPLVYISCLLYVLE